MKSRVFLLKPIKPRLHKWVFVCLFVWCQANDFSSNFEQYIVPLLKCRIYRILRFWIATLHAFQVIYGVLNKHTTRHQQINTCYIFKNFWRKRTEGFSQLFQVNAIKQAVSCYFKRDILFHIISQSIENHNVTVGANDKECLKFLGCTFAFICKLIASGSCRHEQCNGSCNSGRDSCYSIPIKQTCERCPPVPPRHKPIWNHFHLPNLQRTVAIKGAA